MFPPIGAVPIFLSLTENHPNERSYIGLVATFSFGAILIVCLFLVNPLLKAFGIEKNRLCVIAVPPFDTTDEHLSNKI